MKLQRSKPGFITSDGREHKDRGVAAKHQNWLWLVEWCETVTHTVVEPDGVHVAANMVAERTHILSLLRTAEEAP